MNKLPQTSTEIDLVKNRDSRSIEDILGKFDKVVRILVYISLFLIFIQLLTNKKDLKINKN